MNTFSFTPATREAAKARIGLQGPAGSGKTKSALRIAEGLAKGGSIGVIDTERGSALTYAPVPGKPELGGHEFGHMPMDTHDPRHLIQAIAAARAASISVLIVDSWSHFWNGRGGLLTIVEEAGRKPGAGGSFGGWREGNPIEQDMLDALLNYPGHVIATMRTKGDYVIEGKKVTKVGVKAVQREGAEYELGLILDMVEGTGNVTKTRYEPLEGLTIHHPGEDLAEIILEQLGQGVDPIEVLMTDLTAPGLTYEGALALHARAKSRGLLDTGQLHPKTGEPTTIGTLIAEYGTALRSQPAAPSAPAGPAPYSTSDAVAAEGAIGPDQQPASEAVTAPQSRKIFAALAGLGFDNSDRERRLRAISLIVGRQVPTQNDLTFGEAAVVIETLDGFTGDDAADRFREHLNKLLDAAKQPAHA
ncbi:AAA family ATPase [Streptomyces californicus]|uniref:AAA family ATPase n=1 Tax=Streptomyces californicus TaxID=67351 RepID=A0ABX7J5S0_9ACTN|nr:MULTISPECIES: AAA family ATPase [Streptomyces]QRV28771.1 AAA family ATPase [Streptomyces californicus]QRV42185.1 AAA family ATPase [Streptomyces californicus]